MLILSLLDEHNFDIIFHFQVHTILQEHTKQGEVILLIYRGGE